jgi:hypothetical protein
MVSQTDLFVEAVESIKRVRELHPPLERLTSTGTGIYCRSCSHLATVNCPEYVHLIEYPCPTIKALDGKTNG